MANESKGAVFDYDAFINELEGLIEEGRRIPSHDWHYSEPTFRRWKTALSALLARGRKMKWDVGVNLGNRLFGDGSPRNAEQQFEQDFNDTLHEMEVTVAHHRKYPSSSNAGKTAFARRDPLHAAFEAVPVDKTIADRMLEQGSSNAEVRRVLQGSGVPKNRIDELVGPTKEEGSKPVVVHEILHNAIDPHPLRPELSQKMTWKEFRDHIPMSWVVSGFGLLVGAFVAGASVATYPVWTTAVTRYSESDAAKQKDREIAELKARIEKRKTSQATNTAIEPTRSASGARQ